MYMGKNGQEVNKYLDTNPDIIQQIDFSDTIKIITFYPGRRDRYGNEL